jgi:hypothetical protein
LSLFDVRTFEHAFHMGEEVRSFTTLQQSHWDAITALTGALQDADFGPLSDQELLEVTRFPAEERRLVDALSAIAAVRSLLGRLRAAPPHNSAAAG